MHVRSLNRNLSDLTQVKEMDLDMGREVCKLGTERSSASQGQRRAGHKTNTFVTNSNTILNCKPLLRNSYNLTPGA